MSSSDGIDPQFDDPTQYGESESFFSDGIYPPDWDKRRSAVLHRDNYTCQKCGERSGPHAGDEGVELHAHHINPIGDGGSNKLDNLQLVCESCHDQIHHDSDSNTIAVGSLTFVLTSGLVLPTISVFLLDYISANFDFPIAIISPLLVIAFFAVLYYLFPISGFVCYAYLFIIVYFFSPNAMSELSTGSIMGLLSLTIEIILFFIPLASAILGIKHRI